MLEMPRVVGLIFTATSSQAPSHITPLAQPSTGKRLSLAHTMGGNAALGLKPVNTNCQQHGHNPHQRYRIMLVTVTRWSSPSSLNLLSSTSKIKTES